ncbi:MAG: hypothetical protein KW793_02550 [Candidatus Doudnabacteria bacterium]|nr:hypothetical protein [Candidatus Doudnabacteria bacterium]
MRLVEKTLTQTLVDLSRDELLTLKNVLYEAYVEIGEWEFLGRIGLPPEEALVLLKSINLILKKTII